MKIDVHNHAFPEAVIELVNADDAFDVKVEDKTVWYGRWGVGHELQQSLYDPEAKLAELERAGLDAAVICIEPSLFAYESPVEAAERVAVTANRALADFCFACPDRLRWMAHVPLQSPARAVAVLEDAVRAGAVGVEVATALPDRRIDLPEFNPFWGAVERLGITVFAHPAYVRPYEGFQDYYLRNVIGNPLETTVFIFRLICAGVLDRHPGLRVILSHAGGFYPYQAGRLRHARTVRPELEGSPDDPWGYSGQVFIDTITHDRDALRYLVDKFGAANVVMGTDLPYDMATAEPMRSLTEAVGPEAARTIAEEVPARLFGWG